MFQQTIQDVLALAEAGARADAVLECLRARLSAFEPFEGAELMAWTKAGARRFALGRGLGELAPGALAALGDQPTLRIDTAADLKAMGLSSETGINSLLVLRLSAPLAAGAILLGHSRAWSFPGAPLARIRTLGEVALRLLLAGAGPDAGSDEITPLQAEITRLRAHVSTLENEIKGLRSDLGKKR